MSKISIIFLLLSFKLSFTNNCIENTKGCLKCNKETYLCDKCENNALTPDDYGGCKGIKKCTSGENYCLKCNEENSICLVCEDEYYPDHNGGCAYTENCEISYKGECYECINNYFIVGKRNDSIKDFKLCKSYFSSDLKNCEEISEEKGTCVTCENGFFLDDKDFKCTQTQNCSISTFGICTECSYGFYLNKKNNSCLLTENKLLYCKESLNGEICETCDDYYHLTDDYRCMRTNFCSKTEIFDCKECKKGYYLAENKACSISENCHEADYETGYCNNCMEGYYLDLKDRKCKTNKDDENYNFCKIVDGICISCEEGYYLSEDNRCSTSKNCELSEKGICTYCSSYFYLSKDKRCTRIENCLYSNELYECIECEDGFYYDIRMRGCLEVDSNFTNCKISDSLGDKCAYCKNDYYLNYTDNYCYSNSEHGLLYKCALTSENVDFCVECIQDYYFGAQDNKCVNTDGCLFSDEKHICLKCDEGFCLNKKDSLCYYNDEIEEENDKIYYKCTETNEQGTACEICEPPYKVGENGLCQNYYDCEETDGDKCVKCKEDTDWYHMCLNDEYGCVETFFSGCLKCNNIYDLDKCSECLPGYDLNEYSFMCSKN